MECSEARSLIDAGIAPGSRDPTAARLGFHLAGCADCRAYRAAQSALLASLLADAAATPQAAATTQELSPQLRPAPQAHGQPRGRGRVGTIAALLAMGVAVLALSAWLGGKWARTQENLAAMIVTVAPTAPLPTGTVGTTASPAATPAPVGAAEPRTTAPPSPTINPTV